MTDWEECMRDTHRGIARIGLLACALLVFKGIWFLWRYAFSF